MTRRDIDAALRAIEDAQEHGDSYQALALEVLLHRRILRHVAEGYNGVETLATLALQAEGINDVREP